MLPTTLLILDTETTGLEVTSSSVIEIGAILYSVTHRCILQQFSTLLPVAGSNPVKHINQIDAKASRASYPYQLAMTLFQNLHDRADYLIAHNAEFDRKWFGRGLLPPVSKPWLCTCDDFSWPRASKSRLSLVNLALEHGIGVSNAHRALADCQLIATLFDRVDNFEAILKQAIERSQEPKHIFIANVSFQEKNLAKERGFRWNQYIKNKWTKKMRMSDFESEAATIPFPFKVTHIEVASKTVST